MNSLSGWLSWVQAAVNPLVLPFSILAGLVLAAAALSFMALAKSTALARAGRNQSQAVQDRCDAAIATMRKHIEGLGGELNEARRETASVPAAPKPGFNLSTRSQALRMHRRGQPAGQIAAALDVPRQEIDLLLKVHRIVIKNL